MGLSPVSLALQIGTRYSQNYINYPKGDKMHLKYSIVKDKFLTNALVKLGNYSKFPPKFAMQVKRIMDIIYDYEAKIAAEYQALIEKHAKKDEKGNYIPREDYDGVKRAGTFEPHDKEAWDKDYAEFENKTFNISTPPISLKDLEGVGLTPLELRAMESFVTELEMM